MPTIDERLRNLEKVDDAGLMMGYRFLVTSRTKTITAKKAPAKRHAAKNSKRSAIKRKSR